ncbi:MAG TPA: hypothetical protein VK550_31605 [Polyangiaceae bacterium]|nr:hypothetical protein [Polyangiaceae bacterium]
MRILVVSAKIAAFRACAVTARQLHCLGLMDLKIFSPSELDAVLRALRDVAASNDAFTEAERDFVQSVALMHGASVEPDSLPAIRLEEVARVVVDPHRRKRAVQLAIVMALVEGDPSDATQRSVQALAAALDIPEPGLRVLYDLSHGHSMAARIEMLRRIRSFAQGLDGFPGFRKLAVALLGLASEDAVLAARYRALENCAPESFGRAFYNHIVDSGFAFPGEKHGVAAIVFHDIGHVLSGYSVEPDGEIQQAAFQAGFSRNDGFLFLLFGILQFHLGLRITPVAKGHRGLFDVKAVLRAVDRGAACRADFGAGFDVFAYADRPLQELRDELGIPPL